MVKQYSIGELVDNMHDLHNNFLDPPSQDSQALCYLAYFSRLAAAFHCMSV